MYRTPISLSPVYSDSTSPEPTSNYISTQQIPLYYPKKRIDANVGPGFYTPIFSINSKLPLKINQHESQYTIKDINPAPNHYNIKTRLRARGGQLYNSERYQRFNSTVLPAPNQYQNILQKNRQNCKLNTSERFRDVKTDTERCGPGSHDVTHNKLQSFIWKSCNAGISWTARFPEKESIDKL